MHVFSEPTWPFFIIILFYVWMATSLQSSKNEYHENSLKINAHIYLFDSRRGQN